MGRVSFVRGGLLALSTACVVFAASSVRAQTAPPSGGVTLGSEVTHSAPRSGYRANDQISYSDCTADDVITFPLLLSDRQSNTLEVWAGRACDFLANRTTLDANLCWLVASMVPTSNVQTVSIHVRDILAGRTVFPSTAVPRVDTLIADTGAEACIDPSGIPIVTPISLYFMLVDDTKQIAGTSATWNANYKLIGPPPPDVVTATPAPRSLDIHFAYSNNQSSDTTINGYEFYCDPAPGAMIDAGASTACDGLTQTQTLIPGTTPDGRAVCGTAPITATSGFAQGLEVGVPYHVAMAAVDTFQNVGQLSRVTCGIPEDDGTSRACGCAVPGTSPGGALPMLGFAFALLRLSQKRARRSA